MVIGFLRWLEIYIQPHEGHLFKRLGQLGPGDATIAPKVGVVEFQNSHLPHCWKNQPKYSAPSTISHQLDQLAVMELATCLLVGLPEFIVEDLHRHDVRSLCTIHLLSLAAMIAANILGLLYSHLRPLLVQRLPPSHSPNLCLKVNRRYLIRREFSTPEP